MTGKSKKRSSRRASKAEVEKVVVSDPEEEVPSDTSKESSEDTGEEIDTDCLNIAKDSVMEEKELSQNNEEEADEEEEEEEAETEEAAVVEENTEEKDADEAEEAMAVDGDDNDTNEADDADVPTEETVSEETKPTETEDSKDNDDDDNEATAAAETKDSSTENVVAAAEDKKDENTCEITLDLSEDESMDTVEPVVKEKQPTEEEIQERLRRKRLLQEMEERKIDYDADETVEIEADPEFDTEDEVVEESEDFKRYWETVVESPQDFAAWTYLLQLVEQEGKMALIRRAYNSFFKRYPLCYGYWKKFSEVERRKNNVNRARKILERGVRAIPLSVDLWMHVTDFYIKHYKGPDAGVQKVRTIFKRATKAAGEEFRSEKLWKKYINYELESKRFAAVLETYDNVLTIQTQYYQNFFVEFSEFVNGHNPADLLKEHEFEKAHSEARESIAADTSKKASDPLADGKSPEDDLDEGPPGVEDHEKPPTEEELKHIRLQIINKRKEVYNATEQAVTKIWNYEEGIKRPYFHVKPLERPQLKNWREYLDTEIARGDHHRIVLLFERCLIACALYEDFWLKYAKYMTDHNTDKARSIYQRACNIHLPKKPNIHAQWAAFEELSGNLDEAAVILERLDNSLQGMATIKMRRVAVARRAGKLDVAENFLRSYVASASKEKEELFYTRKLAWFLYKLVDKKDEARQLLKDLIVKNSSEVKLYSDLIEMEFHSANVGSTEADEQKAMEAFDIALESESLTEDQKFSFSQKKLEFLEDFGLDVKRLQKSYDDHQKLSKLQKKRQAELAAVADQPPSKKSKTDSNGQIPVVQASSASTTLSNGARYSTSSTGGAAASYTTASTQAHAHQAAYATGDPAASYYSQHQYHNHWNYSQQHPTSGKSSDQYNNYQQQWGSYYGSR